MSYNAPPPPPSGPVGQTPPPNNLVWAILTTLFCCLPLGVVSIVYAAQVNGKFAAGDLAGAQDSSRKAKTWAIWSAVVGLVAIVLYVIFIVIVASNGDSTSTSL
ncbi:CD225/dispanin family protein [Aeromicrobium sp. 636]|uniref:CD225/dispanin family protein n=1 Tax=Aeromicrobium senzhongii TaxID=2663859 RepID=A0A8I0ESF3_9ACTN|nr:MULTISPECIES: CD225/dispanin family protein [Aeromicrobium]MBC9224793.1 CD225/dispanin family protein [Aeromicrobium senzhongii]MCQ3996906.1 CD225/dispanin family protein [Aeromicrobium sp. 636]MTB86840.1 CD225/dispanin family protein [Aeromicrobium senzhongii]QNL93321.1 CD225/dispanin family protein [Aeromicrobium senzhongii]